MLPEEIRNHEEWSVEDINKFYADRGLSFVRVDYKKDIISNSVLKPFLIFHAYTSDKSEVVDGNKNAKKLTRNEEKQIDDMLDPFLQAHNLPTLTGSFGTWTTDYYKGLVAYPIMEDASIRAGALENHLYSDKIHIDTAKTNMNVAGGRNVIPNSAQFLKNQ